MTAASNIPESMSAKTPKKMPAQMPIVNALRTQPPRHNRAGTVTTI